MSKPGGAALPVVLKGWPRLSETFIAQELLALERAGIELELWSLRHPTDTKTHPLHDALKARVNYLPEYLHQEPVRVLSGLAHAIMSRRFWSCFGLFFKDLKRDWTRNRIRRFGQALVLNRELPADSQAIYAHFLHTPSSVARYTAVLRAIPWGFAAHAKDIWQSPDWEIETKLGQMKGSAAFGATCTKFGADRLNEFRKERPIELIYHGLDLTRFPKPPPRDMRKSGAPLRLISVGRLVEKKGFDRLIEAFALLEPSIDWHWTHIGGGSLKTALLKQAQAAGLADRITWKGACDQPEVIDAMRSSDLFILPSRVAEDGDRDGLPNVLMEAASQKLPIISTPVAAIPEFIDDGVSGLLSSDAPEALAKAITDLNDHPERAAEYAQAAYERLCSEFQMQPGINKLINILRGHDFI